ncbi:tetratricopeptide repeat protein [Virgibacillus halophilus]|uniref:Tetratricopeptide repeat protein n=2 Tax=Tigheibacillus halophilus TaxID=361280 RepID=A0ABU5CAZ5_9BACI|nr:tetratricopeptide repeat protein [Virgibacillus halophilus]
MQDRELMDLLQELEKIKDGEMSEAVSEMTEEFKRGHFPNVVYKIGELREQYQLNDETENILSLLSAVCYIQMKEYDKATAIIRTLFEKAEADDADNLLFLSEMAFMCSVKLARRIATAALKQMETSDFSDRFKLARCFLILGESEEKMDKLPRSAKYYRKALEHFHGGEERDQHMILFLHFKLGMLYAAMNQVQDAVNFHLKVIEMSPEKEQENLRIHSLISIGKIYGSREADEKAVSYLKQALDEITETSLEETYTHAEALTEMAFYYFDKGMLDEALPLYEHAIRIYADSKQSENRKLGMIYMQYGYCLEHKKKSEINRAAQTYDKAIAALEAANDPELLENALADVIAFF